MSAEDAPQRQSFADLVDRADRVAQKESVARDLYQRIGDHLRGDQARTARRWPWELIQNAHDVSSLELGVNITVRLDLVATQPTLSFEHDAGPFSPEDLVCLVKRHSGKRGAPGAGRPAPLGRFGTGFLSTHLLARHVDLSGVVAGPGAELRRFELPLDRTGTTEEELGRGVELTFDALRSMGTLPPVDAVERPSTTYRYRLQPDGLQAALAGLDVLERLVPFVLAFVPAVRSVTIETVDEGPCGAAYTSTRYAVVEVNALPDGIHHVRVGKTATAEEDGEFSLLLAGDGYSANAPDPAGEGGVLVAVRVGVGPNGVVTVHDLEDDTPRLFCGLPLVGTEALGLPFVVSSRAFAPTPERDGLVLTDARDVQVRSDSDANKRLLQAAVRHYGAVLDAASAWRRAYALAGVPDAPGLGWLQDKEWYEDHVTAPLRQAVVQAPLVERPDGTRGVLGRHAANKKSRVPAGRSREARAALWDLARPLMGKNLPERQDIEPWRDRLSWTSFYDLEAFHLIALASENETLAALADALGLDEAGALSWAQRVVDHCKEHGRKHHLYNSPKESWGKAAGKPYKKKKWTWPVAFVPDQRGDLREVGDLLHDPGLPDQLKVVSAELGQDVRHKLAAVNVSGLREELSVEDLARSVEDEVFDRLDDADESVGGAFADLLAWFDDNPDEAARLFKRLYPRQHLLRTAEEARRDRRDAADARRLRDENEALADANAELRAEIERLRQTSSDVAATFPLDDVAVQLKHHVLDVWDAVRKALAFEGATEAATAADLEKLRQQHPSLFIHLSRASIEKYVKWRAMVERAKQRTRAKMDELGYDTDGWRSVEAFPTIVEGVRRHPVRGDRMYPPHEIILVVRPADSGFVVLYDDQEVAVLQNADTELWIEGDGLGPQRFTIGHLAEALDANRFPVRSRSTVASTLTN